MLYWTINMVIMLLFANSEVNSRVTSTMPFYYWAVAELMMGGKRMGKLGKLALAHNVVYMLFNFALFPMEVGFF